MRKKGGGWGEERERGERKKGEKKKGEKRYSGGEKPLLSLSSNISLKLTKLLSVPQKYDHQLFRIQRCPRHHRGLPGRPDASDAGSGRVLGWKWRWRGQSEALARGLCRGRDGRFPLHEELPLHASRGAGWRVFELAVPSLCAGEGRARVEVSWREREGGRELELRGEELECRKKSPHLRRTPH